MSITGARSLVNSLGELGVEVAFGLPGAHALTILGELADNGVRVIGVRHEQAAGHAADAYARTTGALGVALVTTGPGAVNTLGAVREAYASASPVLVISTDAPSESGATLCLPHGDCDQRVMFEALTKAAFTVESPAEIASVVQRAASVALRPQSGPCFVGIPAHFLGETVPESVSTAMGSPEPPGTPPCEDIERARKALLGSQRPLLWVGGGALRSGAGEAVGTLAERLAAPIITTFGARGIVSPEHPCLASTPVHAPEVGALWDEADVVLAVGTDLDDPMTQDRRMPQPPTLIAVNVDAEDAAKNYPPDQVLLGDAGDVVKELSLGVVPRTGVDELTRRLDDIEERVRRRVRKEEPPAAELLTALRETLPEGAVLVSDVCVAGQWISGFYRVSGPRQLVSPANCGTVGFGFPASLGIAAAGAVRAVCVTGPGGFLPGCAELATAIQQRMPVTVVIVDDGGYGLEWHDRVSTDVVPPGADLAMPDFVGLSKSFGVYAERVDGFGRAFRRLLREFTRSDEPNVLSVTAQLRPPLTAPSRWYR